MSDESKKLAASNLTIAFYSGTEKRPAFLGKDRRLKDVPPKGLDMRNPAISPDEVYQVYKEFLQMMEKDK